MKDDKLIQVLRSLGYNTQAISEALDRERFEEIHATYLMLKASKSDVDSTLVNSPAPSGQADAIIPSSGGQPTGTNAVRLNLLGFNRIFSQNNFRVCLIHRNKMPPNKQGGDLMYVETSLLNKYLSMFQLIISKLRAH
jgi:hypothetical protein